MRDRKNTKGWKEKADKRVVDNLLHDMEQFRALLGQLDQETKAAAKAAAAAAASAANALSTAALASGDEDAQAKAAAAQAAAAVAGDAAMADQLGQLDRIRAQLEAFETTADARHADGLEGLKALQKKIDPLTGLPFDLDKIRLEELPDKASAADLEKLRMQQEQVCRCI